MASKPVLQEELPGPEDLVDDAACLVATRWNLDVEDILRYVPEVLRYEGCEFKCALKRVVCVLAHSNLFDVQALLKRPWPGHYIYAAAVALWIHFYVNAMDYGLEIPPNCPLLSDEIAGNVLCFLTDPQGAVLPVAGAAKRALAAADGPESPCRACKMRAG
jgi:hypothetical protein